MLCVLETARKVSQLDASERRSVSPSPRHVSSKTGSSANAQPTKSTGGETRSQIQSFDLQPDLKSKSQRNQIANENIHISNRSAMPTKIGDNDGKEGEEDAFERPVRARPTLKEQIEQFERDHGLLDDEEDEEDEVPSEASRALT